MWYLPRSCITLSRRHFVRAIVRNNLIYKEAHIVCAAKKIPLNARYLQTTLHLYDQNKSQYEYDPKSDTFRPKSHINYTDNNKQSDKKGSSFLPFVKRFLRNLFLITGGVVWISVVLVSLFIDINEEELLYHVKDLDDEVRLLAFYDIGQNKEDLAKIMSKEKQLSEIHEFHHITNRKQTSFLKVIRELQENDIVNEKLGTPVHLCGFRAAEKIAHMTKDFKHLKEHGFKEHLKDDTTRNTWNAECILEGTKALGLLSLEFQRSGHEGDWVAVHIKLTLLDQSGQSFMEREGSLPLGISLN